jgi:hypothetical protein
MMKKNILLRILVLSFVLLLQISCKKDSTDSDNFPIQGLWEGTYTVGDGYPVPNGTSFYFSFSVYPGGKVSYKSKGYYNGSSDYITFADGVWTLNGSTFSFNVTTVNTAGGGQQQAQTGTATYNSSKGTLTNGVFSGSNATWLMTKVK